MKYAVYDIECLSNVFTIGFKKVGGEKTRVFEISPRKNQAQELVDFIFRLKELGYSMVGFNNNGYDYPMIHHLLRTSDLDDWKWVTHQLYIKSKSIIETDDPFAHTVWDNEHVVAQIDLYKIHHFDNQARRTSLKRLQFNMRRSNVHEFELDFNKPLTKYSEIDALIAYMIDDIDSTEDFLRNSMSQVQFRIDLGEKHDKYYMNHNDTKIGEDYLTDELLKKVGWDTLYYKGDDGKRKKKGTHRDVVPIKDIIFDNINFNHPEFNRVLDQLRGMKMFVIDGKFHWSEHNDYREGYRRIQALKIVIKVLNKEIKKIKDKDLLDEKKQVLARKKTLLKKLQSHYVDHKISCEVDGFTFDFGKGGLHGSVESRLVKTTKDRVIYDLDVTSFYPSIGIMYNLYPAHLGIDFCGIYAEQKTMRLKYAKGTPENAMLKLALNGSYGKTNSRYSVFYDPLYTMTTTINGQLMLCMLWDNLRHIDGLEIIQANTDGITISAPRDPDTKRVIGRICRAWQEETRMQLEFIVYKQMAIRDVNNYIVEKMDGSVKAKGAYVYQSLYHKEGMRTDNIEWHKNHSSLIVQMAVEAELVKGIPAHKFIMEHENVYDFFLCTNVNKASRLVHEFKGRDHPIQRVTRYLVTNEGGRLMKIMPPLPGEKEHRRIGISVGWNTTEYNIVPESHKNAHDYDINYSYYIEEADKLLEPFKQAA